MTELAEVRRYWPRARGLRGVYGSTHTLSGSGARVRFHYSYLLGQFVFQFERLHTNRRSWVTVRVLNCGDDFPKAMKEAGFGLRPLGGFALYNRHKAERHKHWREDAGRDAQALADRQRPRKGVRLGRRKKEAMR